MCAPDVFCFDIGSHGLTLTFHSHKHTFTHTCSCMCTYSLPTHTHIHFLPYFHSRSLICFPAACFHKILFRFRRSLTTRTEILFLAVTFHCEMSTVFTFPPSGFRRFLHLQNHLTLHLLLSFLFFFSFSTRQIRNTAFPSVLSDILSCIKRGNKKDVYWQHSCIFRVIIPFFLLGPSILAPLRA